MTTRIQHFGSLTATNAPTTTGLEPREIAVNPIDNLIFIGDGSNAYTQVDGTAGAAPPAAKGFRAYSLQGGGGVYSANAVTKAAAIPTTAELTTAFGNPGNLAQGDTGIITAGEDAGVYTFDGTNWIKDPTAGGGQVFTAATAAGATTADINTAIGATATANPLSEGATAIITTGANAAIYKYDGTDWIQDPNSGIRVTDVSAVATVALADAVAGSDEGDVIIIADTTGLTGQTTFNAIAREAPPAGFVEGAGSPISYIFNGAGTWSVFSTPLDISYTNGNGIAIANAGTNAITFSADYGTSGDANIDGTGNPLARFDHNHYIGGLFNVNSAVATVAGANQGGLLVRDTSVAAENSADAYKLVTVLDGGTF